MPGPAPKDPKLRQRVNKKSEAAELSAPIDPKIPTLPNPDKRKWHRLTRVWWKDLWRSPMSVRYLSTDAGALGMVALLVDDFYKCTSAKDRRELAAEIRQQTARFGLSNWDRNRMNWTVTEAPEDKPRPQARPSTQPRDPRSVLRALK